MKRFRPRFSIRTLVVVVPLVCCYAACWGPTKKWGPAHVQSHVNDAKVEPGEFRLARDAEAIAPLIIATDDVHLERLPGFGYVTPNAPPPQSRSYYFWFFGYVAKLPYDGAVRDKELAQSRDRPGPKRSIDE